MASQGPNDPAAAVDDTSAGTLNWSDHANCFTSDDSRASISLDAAEVSYYLRASDFGFTVPIGRTIEGIVVEVERNADDAGVNDFSVRLFTVSPAGSDKADAVTDWPGSDGYATYGANNDLWGLSLGPTDVNDSDFGVCVSAVNNGGSTTIARIDHIRITVYYSPVTHSATGNAEAVISSAAILSQTSSAAGSAEAVISSAVILSQTHTAAGNAEAVVSSAVVLSMVNAASGNAEAVISSTVRLWTGSTAACVHVDLAGGGIEITLEPQWEVAIANAPRWACTISLEVC
jgi:hypothetical protein